MLQACLNGARLPSEHPQLPVTIPEVCAEAAASVAAGADDLHVHPKDPDGRDVLDPDIVGATLTALRKCCSSVSIGITTGVWAATAERRIRTVAAWSVLPGHVSVNFHEPAAEQYAAWFLSHGVAVDAGLWTGTDGIERLLASGLASRCRYLLVEVTESEVKAGLAAVRRLLPRVLGLGPPVLLHGEGATTWPMIAAAGRLGLAARIGFEDTLLLPDGRTAQSNAQLVTIAMGLLGKGRG